MLYYFFVFRVLLKWFNLNKYDKTRWKRCGLKIIYCALYEIYTSQIIKLSRKFKNSLQKTTKIGVL